MSQEPRSSPAGAAPTERLKAAIHCACIIERASSPQQLSQQLAGAPSEVKAMLLAYYQSRQAYEYCAILAASQPESG